MRKRRVVRSISAAAVALVVWALAAAGPSLSRVPFLATGGRLALGSPTLDRSFQSSDYYGRFADGLCRFDPHYPSDGCNDFFPIATWPLNLAEWPQLPDRIVDEYVNGVDDSNQVDDAADISVAAERRYNLWYIVDGVCNFSTSSPDIADNPGKCTTPNPRTSDSRAWTLVVAGYAMQDEPDRYPPYGAGTASCVLPSREPDPCAAAYLSDVANVHRGDAKAYGRGTRPTRPVMGNFTKDTEEWAYPPRGWSPSQFDAHIRTMFAGLDIIADDVFGWTDQYEWSQASQSGVGNRPNAKDPRCDPSVSIQTDCDHYGAWVYGHTVARIHELDPHDPKLPVFSQIECCNASDSGSDPMTNVITPQMIDTGMWNALVHGVQGFTEFDYDFPDEAAGGNDAENPYPDAEYYASSAPFADHQWDANYDQMQGENMEIEAFAPYLNSPTVARITAKSNLTQGGVKVPIATLGKLVREGERTYLWLIAQADGDTRNELSNLRPMTGTIQLPRSVAPGTQFEVYGENRMVTVDAEHQIVDTFDTTTDTPNYTAENGTAATNGPLTYGYQHHIYVQAGLAGRYPLAPLVAVDRPSSDPDDPTTVSSSSVALGANAASGAGIRSVQFRLDGKDIGSPVTTPAASSTGFESSYVATWDSRDVRNGRHTLTAVVVDQDGRSAISRRIPIIVNNDDDPATPTVRLTATPVAGNGTRLRWQTSNPKDPASRCSAGPWSGSIGPSGTTMVAPRITTTYSIVCTDARRNAAAAGVTVEGTPRKGIDAGD